MSAARGDAYQHNKHPSYHRAAARLACHVDDVSFLSRQHAGTEQRKLSLIRLVQIKQSPCWLAAAVCWTVTAVISAGHSGEQIPAIQITA